MLSFLFFGYICIIVICTPLCPAKVSWIGILHNRSDEFMFQRYIYEGLMYMSSRQGIMCFRLPNRPKGEHEDAVVGSRFRGHGIGRALMEHIIGFALREQAPADLNLTSVPERVVVNEFYRKMGFERMGTNVYRMKL